MPTKFIRLQKPYCLTRGDAKVKWFAKSVKSSDHFVIVTASSYWFKRFAHLTSPTKQFTHYGVFSPHPELVDQTIKHSLVSDWGAVLTSTTGNTLPDSLLVHLDSDTKVSEFLNQYSSELYFTKIQCQQN